jgi:5-methyltetrahydropteroyltriglutamate--homocysteine methyltransferase
MLESKLPRHEVDEGAFEHQLPAAVAEIVGQQMQTGLDIVNDGEVSKPHFVSYIEQRLTGFETREISEEESAAAFYLAGSREYRAFLEYYQPERTPDGAHRDPRPRRTFCTGPVSYKGRDQLQRDIANLRAALG